MSEPIYCPYCASENIRTTTKHGEAVASYEIGFNQEKEESLQQGEAEIYFCQSCCSDFLVDCLSSCYVPFRASSPIPPSPIPPWMVIDAVRYCLGQRTYQVSLTTQWLMKNWDNLHATTQSVIQHDIEMEFTRDPQALGDEIDVERWNRVRELWRKK